MRRIYLFLWYCISLQWPVEGIYFFSIPYVWRLARIADNIHKWDDPAKIADFFDGPPTTGKEPYEAFEEWAKKHGYDIDDDVQLDTAIKAYGSEE